MNQAKVNPLERIVTLDAVICDLGGIVTRTSGLRATAGKRLLSPASFASVAGMLKDPAR